MKSLKQVIAYSTRRADALEADAAAASTGGE